MSAKSKDALCFTIDRLSEQGRLYFWTFTFADLLEVPEARKRWQLCLRELVRVTGFLGVRVYEMHEDHGLHIHAIVCGKYPLRLVRLIVAQYGFGRIHVARVSHNPYYISKYVNKADRPECLKGCRLWAAFGGSHEKKSVHTRTRDIEYDSLWHRAAGWVKHRLGVQGLKSLRMTSFVLGLAIECGDDLRGDCWALESTWRLYWMRLKIGQGVPCGWDVRRWRLLLASVAHDGLGGDPACGYPSPSGAPDAKGVADAGVSRHDNLVIYQTTPNQLQDQALQLLFEGVA